MIKRIVFGLLFLAGTLAAAIGWFSSWFNIQIDEWVTIAGHIGQIVGIFGVLITPDEIEYEEEMTNGNL